MAPFTVEAAKFMKAKVGFKAPVVGKAKGGGAKSGEAERMPLVKKVTRSTALQIADKRVGKRNPFRFKLKMAPWTAE